MVVISAESAPQVRLQDAGVGRRAHNLLEVQILLLRRISV